MDFECRCQFIQVVCNRHFILLLIIIYIHWSETVKFVNCMLFNANDTSMVILIELLHYFNIESKHIFFLLFHRTKIRTDCKIYIHLATRDTLKIWFTFFIKIILPTENLISGFFNFISCIFHLIELTSIISSLCRNFRWNAFASDKEKKFPNFFIHRIASLDETTCPWAIWLNCCKNNDNEMIYNSIDILALLFAHPRCIAAGCSPEK